MNSLPVVYKSVKTLSGTVPVREAMDDGSAQANVSIFRNPLWIMPIGMGVFFAIAAAVMALS